MLPFCQIKELTVSMEGLEKERDFYFGKLRDIEVLCQEGEQEGVHPVKQILEILYATEVSVTIYCKSLDTSPNDSLFSRVCFFCN